MLIGGGRAGVVVAAGAVLAAVAMTVASGCSTTPPKSAPPGAPSLVTSTTQIASAGVLGNQRRPDESCAPEPARLDPAAPDPQRIVVLAGDELDALCALGLQTRIVAAALPDGSTSQPSYLGTVIHDLPGAGTRSAPDLTAIAAAKPDLILGSQALTPQSLPQLTAIAPTVFADAPGADWQDNVRAVGAATGRAQAAADLIGGFTEQAKQKGMANDAPHFQASIVQFTDTTMRVYGAANFPASVLADVGVDRPAAQRFTDKPYIEIGISDADLDRSPDLSAADGDIVYLSFASPAAKDRAPAILDSAPWRKLSANRDNRVFVVNNEVWQTGQGLVAARGILDDLRWLNAPIN
ncbi:Fe3+-citrate ABC transporter substrate-binding protein [Mycolicibacterium aromaticivorans JS19b1 = JCM 16368]|uniref:Fe3+-citrate ABC transporter substrate-binding protein n=1 Tax=Mycolicibacterium aromaticivorans JS19b1 = JCM 16368 TaxID=1440774 RepID=A0A064CBZ3_9MYCO|nr:iron-siderophore ABC transporter substrate-binding protein [Mycolicibacterium aromaticivorans]KDE98159.1 Fe3+-citrate ABC transporter substrate-binding protein [Mycolicibacterium aromaticivorans JS19b1 = JCM 16368]